MGGEELGMAPVAFELHKALMMSILFVPIDLHIIKFYTLLIPYIGCSLSLPIS